MNKPWVKRACRRRHLSKRAEERKRNTAKSLNGWKQSLYIDKDGRTRNVYYGDTYWKRRSNKAVRKECDVFSRGAYKKVFDYWWTVS